MTNYNMYIACIIFCIITILKINYEESWIGNLHLKFEIKFNLNIKTVSVYYARVTSANMPGNIIFAKYARQYKGYYLILQVLWELILKLKITE